MILFKTVELDGAVSFGTSTSEEAVPEGAILFNDAAAYRAAIDAIVNPPPTLEQLRAARLAALDAACAAAIMGGFTSSALGTPHTYPSTDTDQLNLYGSVTASMLGPPDGWTTPFSCMDANGTWSFAPHTATQIKQVGLDLMQVVLVARRKLKDLQAEVVGAATAEAIAAVVWG